MEGREEGEGRVGEKGVEGRGCISRYYSFGGI